MTPSYVNRLTAATEHLLGLALREALSNGSNYIEPDHLLLAMARDSQSHVGERLLALGVDGERLRELVLDRLREQQRFRCRR